MFELIIKDIMEVAGLPADRDSMWMHSSRGLSRVYSESCREKGQCRRTCEEVNSVVSAGGVSGGDGSYCVPVQRAGLKARH